MKFLSEVLRRKLTFEASLATVTITIHFLLENKNIWGSSMLNNNNNKT